MLKRIDDMQRGNVLCRCFRWDIIFDAPGVLEELLPDPMQPSPKWVWEKKMFTARQQLLDLVSMAIRTEWNIHLMAGSGFKSISGDEYNLVLARFHWRNVLADIIKSDWCVCSAARENCGNAQTHQAFFIDDLTSQACINMWPLIQCPIVLFGEPKKSCADVFLILRSPDDLWKAPSLWSVRCPKSVSEPYVLHSASNWPEQKFICSPSDKMMNLNLW